MTSPRASRASSQPRSPRLADSPGSARGAAILLLLSLMAAGGGVGVSEAIFRLAQATGVEATLRDAAGIRGRLDRAVALLARARSAGALSAAIAPGALPASLRSAGNPVDRSRLLRAAAGPLAHSDLPPPAPGA